MLTVLLCSSSILTAEIRTFTSSAGTTLQGELVSVDGDTVTIKKADGQSLTLKIAVFSQADQTWLQSQGGPAPSTTSPAPTSSSASAIVSKAAQPLPYADMIQEIRWKGQPVSLEYRGPLAASVKPLGKINAHVWSLAFHPDGRLGFTYGSGAGENMGISYWDGKGGTSSFLKLTYEPAPGDRAQRAEAEVKGIFGSFSGSLAFDQGGRCFFTTNSGSSADALWLVKTAEPVLLERLRPAYRFNTLQIPAFDDTHLYAQTGVNIQRVSLESAKTWKEGMEEWFQFKGKDAYLGHAIMLNADRLLVGMSIKPPGSPKVDVTKPFPWVYQTLLLDMQQLACWLLPDKESGPMAVSWDGAQIVRFHARTSTLFEIKLPGAK